MRLMEIPNSTRKTSSTHKIRFQIRGEKKNKKKQNKP